MPHHAVIEAEKTNNFLVPNGTFFFELICFVIIVFIIAKWVLPIIVRAIDERQASIAKQFQDAEDAKARLEAAEQEYQAALAETRRDASRLREQAQAERAQIVEEARSEAQSKVEEMLASAAERVAAERQQAVLALRNEIGELATTLAERVVHASLQDDARQRQLVADFIAGVGAEQVVVAEELAAEELA
ncbi:MAG TPA: F0F1 ATP synthase subunit B [Mycobacteriales bacterium]|nr:F0F1 ATP synthase subunit B [Mycobacteriales bacterium]